MSERAILPTRRESDRIKFERLREILDYNPETGVFRWRTRLSLSSQWNGRFAGTVAGTINAHGYRCIFIDARPYLAHRLAWLWIHGEFPSRIDHIDCDKANNRIANLRVSTRSQNHANTGKPSSNTRGFKGVTWDKRARTWVAQIKVNGRRIYLGQFDTAGEAHAAYIAAAHTHFGEFARSQ